MSVPFLDLGGLHQRIRPELDAAIDRVVRAGSFVGGPDLPAFEEELAGAHGVAAAAGCGSGTDALALALRALGVGVGDEVIVPSMTFVATAEAVVHAGATPVLADVDPVTLLLDPASVAERRTERTRAVVPVHLYGHMVDPAALQAWRDDGLVVLEDAAQAHLAERDGVGVGTVGHAACFSFYPGKNLGALGDGGAVISADVGLVEEVRRLRDHGRSSKYLHDEIGWCSRLDGLQAAVLRVKLAHLGEWTEGRRAAAERYREAIADLLVPWEAGAVHHLLVTRVPERDAVREALGEGDVASGVHYPVPLSLQPSLGTPGGCPASEAAGDDVLSLPMDPFLAPEQIDEVVAALRRALDAVGGG